MRPDSMLSMNVNRRRDERLCGGGIGVEELVTMNGAVADLGDWWLELGARLQGVS